MRIAGYAHNSGLYLPELRPKAKTAAVPEADVRLIGTVFAEPVPARRVSRATVRRAAREEIDALWPGEPYDPTLYAATLTRLGTLEALDEILVDPQVEPVLLDRDETAKPERFGHERAPGPGSYLLAGLDGRIQLVELARLAARTTRLLRRARRLRAGKPSAPLPRGAEACLAALATCERLWISGVDWGPRAAPTRELWRLAATAAAARRLGLRVVVEPGALPPQAGTVDRILARLIGGS